MVNFELIIEMIELISIGDWTRGLTFNEFCVKFYLETKTIPLSKFLKMRGYSNKTPKIMNTRKAGEILFESRNKDEIIKMLEKYKYTSIPELNYSAIMVLRKVSLDKNWEKLISYIKGEGTIDEIIRNNKKSLLPEESLTLNEFLQKELQLNSSEFKWFLEKFKIVTKNKVIHNSLVKLL